MTDETPERSAPSPQPADQEDELPPLPNGDVIMDDTDVERSFSPRALRKAIKAIEAKLDAERRGSKRPRSTRRTRPAGR